MAVFIGENSAKGYWERLYLSRWAAKECKLNNFVGERENQTAWEEVLEDLKRRGGTEVGLWITDGNQAMLKAIGLKFSASQRQRCIKHKMTNVRPFLGYRSTSGNPPALFRRSNDGLSGRLVNSIIMTGETDSAHPFHHSSRGLPGDFD